MSEQKQNDETSSNHEKVVPDAVNGRLTQKPTIECCDCKEILDREDIASHYRDHSLPVTKCISCQTIVYNYIFKIGTNKPKHVHFCPKCG